jgi:hypothetical protein
MYDDVTLYIHVWSAIAQVCVYFVSLYAPPVVCPYAHTHPSPPTHTHTQIHTHIQAPFDDGLVVVMDGMGESFAAMHSGMYDDVTLCMMM